MKVLVIGDSCDDKFIYGKCERICPEAPVPVFNPVKEIINGGMTKNVFNNLKSLAPKWQIDLITNDKKITKTRIVDIKTNQMLVRIDEKDTCPRIPNVTNLGYYDAVVISDYNKGFLHKDDIKILLERYSTSFIDSKKIFGDYIKKASFIKINQAEYQKNTNNLVDYRGQLIVTLGEEGVAWNGIKHYPTRQAEVSDLSGAGDTFLAAFVYHYLSKQNISKAINFAQDCALEVVEKKGVVIVENNLDI